MKSFFGNDIFRVSAVFALIICLFFSVTPASRGAFDVGIVSAAEYDAGTETELHSMIATAPDGSVINITTDITLTSGLAWDDKALTIKGADADVTLERGAGLGNVSMFSVGGTDPSFTTPAGVLLRDITIDDAGNPSGMVYDGIISAYRQGVSVTLGSGVSLLNSGGGSSVRLEGLAPAGSGATLTMLEGSRILYAKSGNGTPGAGVFVGTGAAFTMKGGIIQSNRTSAQGGGVYVAGGATFLMEDGLVKGNTASAGGGVFISGDGAGGAFVMKGGSVTGNILSGSAASQNKHGDDVAVGAPSGSDVAKRGAAPDYSDAAYSAEIYPGASIGSDKVGVQNAFFNQAVYIPDSRKASVWIGALPQYAGTAVLDSLQAEAAFQMPAADPAYQGLTYAGNVLYSPDNNSGTVTFRLNYPDEIPAYDNDGLNVRNRYGYALAYVALDQNGAAMSAVRIVTPIRDAANLIAEIPAVSGAASYGIAKYYYNKSGALDVNIGISSGGSLKEKRTGIGGALHFDSVPSGAAFVPSPAAYTLVATADSGWHTKSVTLTAGDGYVTEKDVEAGGEITLYYTDLAQGTNQVEAVFARDDGTISLSMNDAAFVYDGKPHRVAATGIAKGDEVRYMYRVGDSGFIAAQGNPSFTEVNEVIADSVAGGVNGDEIMVYVIVTRGAVSARDSATLTISPRPITVKPVDRTKKRDGAALRPNKVEISAGTLVQGHSLDVSSAVFGGSRTKVGTAVSTVSGVSITGANPANYAISYTPGVLKVTKPDAEEDGDKDKDDGDKDDGDGDGDNGGGNGDNGGSSGGGGTVGSPDEPGVPADDDGDVDEENDADVTDDDGDEDGTDPGDDDKEIEEDPTPKDPGSDKEKEDTVKDEGVLAWWLIVIVIIIAAALCVLIAYLRRRGKNDEEDADEAHWR